MKSFLLFIKILFSFALIYFLISKVDFSSVKHIIGIENAIRALGFGLLVMFLQTCIAGARLSFLMPLYGYQLGVLSGIRMWFIGNFFSQTMISFVGGDAIRVWYLKRNSTPTKTAVSVILLDRVIGFAALILLFLILLPFLIKIIPENTMRYGVMLLALGSSAALLGFILLGMLPSYLREMKGIGWLVDFTSSSRHLFVSKKKSSMAFLLSLALQFSNILLIYGLFRIYGNDVGFFWCFVMATPALLISMLPISIAGWGVRESAMVMGFALLNISANNTLAVSLSFGLISLLSSLPGVVFFLSMRRQERQAIC